MLSTIQRRRTAASLTASLLLAAPAIGEEDPKPEWFPGGFSANVAIANDYPFRGISQTDEEASIQGGIDYSAEIVPGLDFYAGSWGSNVNFKDGDQAQLELDIYGGFSGSVDAFSWDVTTIFYAYPGAKSSLDYDYIEFGPKLGYDFGVASASIQYLWSPDYFAGSDDSHFLTGGVAVPVTFEFLPEWLEVSVDGNLGVQYIDDESAFGARDYVLWDLGTTLSMFGVDVDLRYVDTDLSSSSCFGGTHLCDERFVASVGISF